MEMLAFEDYSQADHELTILANQLNDLQTMRNRIAVEGICKDDARIIDQISPDIMESINVNMLTPHLSNTKQVVALEEIDWKRVGIIAVAITAVTTLILRILNWIAGKFQMSKATSNATAELAKTEAKIKEVESKPVMADPIQVKEVEKSIIKALAFSHKDMHDVNANYLTKLANDFNTNKLKDIHGKKLKYMTVYGAGENYAAFIKVLGKSSFKPMQSALAGTMLTSKAGGIPKILKHIKWEGGDRSATISSKDIDNALITMRLATKLMSYIEIYETIIADAHKQGVKTWKNGSDTLHIAIDSKSRGGRYLLDKMIDMRKTISEEIRSAYRGTSLENFLTITDAFVEDVPTRVILNGEVRKILEDVKAIAGTYITMWPKGTIHDYKAVDVPTKRDCQSIFNGLCTQSGRAALAEMQVAIYGEGTGSQLSDVISEATAALKRAKATSDRIMELAKDDKYGWLHLMVGKQTGKFNLEKNIFPEINDPMFILKDILEVYKIASGIETEVGKLLPTFKVLADAAGYSIKYVDRSIK